MTDRAPHLSDATIEAALARRAPGHADAGLLRGIVAKATATPQARGWAPRISLGRRPFRPLLAVAATVGIVGSLLVLGGGSHPTPSPRPRTSPAALASQPASSSPAPSGPCPTETARVAIGSAMGPQVGVPIAIGAGIVARGAYVTRTNADSGEPAEIWSVKAGFSKRIATVDGPDLNTVAIDDVSQDGTLVLLAVGRLSGSGARPECIDLYLIWSDGSGLTRLTHDLNGEDAIGGRISADNRSIGYFHDTLSPRPLRSSFVTIDRFATTQDPNHERFCSSTSWDANLAWEPDGQGLAALCGTQVVVEDTSANAADAPFDATQLMAFDWQPVPGLVIAAAHLGEPANTIDIWTLPFSSAASFPGLPAPRTVPVPFEAVTGDGAGLISPNGEYLLVEGMLPSYTPGDIGWFGIRLSDGTTTPIVAPRGIEPSWSADSRSVLYVQPSDTGMSLVVHVVATGDESLVRPLPAGFVQGVWHRG